METSLLEGLWNQFSANPQTTGDGLLLETEGEDSIVELPELPDFVTRDFERADYGTKDLRRGFTLDLRVDATALQPGEVLLDNRDVQGQGFCLRVDSERSLEFTAFDRLSRIHFLGDPALLGDVGEVAVGIVLDGGPKIALYVVNGILDDGGDRRQFGWERFNPHFRSLNGGSELKKHPGVKSLRLYDRALRVSELVQNHRVTD